jgi:predicted kinase
MVILVTGLQGSGKSTVAAHCAQAIGAPVFAWDWSVAALTPFEPLQAAMRTLDRDTYRNLGWAMVLQNARPQLLNGMNVVLDGMARADNVQSVRDLAVEFGVPSVVMLTACDDLDEQQRRVEGRRRDIPGWHELSWDDVQRSRRAWAPPADVDVVLDTSEPIDETMAAALRALPH